MAWRRASFASLAVVRSSAVMRPLVAGLVDSEAFGSSVHWGQRLAKPGLSGFSSNSSLQMAQILTGKGISTPKMILNHGWAGFLGFGWVKCGAVRRTEVVLERSCGVARMGAGQGGHA
jgi:hypothetical protein